ncbi:Glycine cleavage system transcriptional activator [Marinomonas aquimarina]|uniref:Glycine cleavage system transcriptional activator n=1 Tax=Marinomonas aquimarina TaxID=295068 RepID=A0A1A8TIE3_9GAMM|nr:LysR substrate-binding domain-containing protein [Marinomonas aquimarina]SBS32206.1 Glycine cleavage system transcriptional activator [Marinomonas aquimarina]
MQRLTLPPLNALRTFESAARQSSFKLAAEELCVTQAAVSKQIQALEDYYNLKLFIRHNRAVSLTQEGEQLRLAVSSALRQISDTSQSLLAKQSSDHLSLYTTTSFAQLWFMPRFKAFGQSFPDIQLHLISGDESPNCAEGFETAIALGWQDHPDYIAVPLFSEEIFPVCTPEFFAQHPEIRCANDLLGLPLLNLSASYWKARLWTPMDWDAWFLLQGIERSESRSDLQFSQFSMLLDAVHQGLGVGLGWQHLVQNSLDSGRLVKLFPDSYLADDRVHYFVYHRSKAQSHKVKNLRDWLLQQVALSGGSTS